jgi:hypothetical protein
MNLFPRKILRRSIVSATLLGLAAAAFGQITSEVPVSTPVDQPVASVFQMAIASDGDGFLAVWCDQRDHGSVYAARIAHDGTILDPRGIFLANTNSPVAVAWTGDRYLVAWNGVSSIIGAQLAMDGHFLAQPRAIVTKGLISNSRHPIATNGSVIVLMTSSGYSVLDRDANIVDSGRFGESAYVTGSGEFLLTAAVNSRRLDSSGHYVTSAPGTSQQIIACHASGCLTASSLTTSIGIARYDPDAMTVGKFANLPIATRALDLVADADGYLLITDTISQQLDDDGHPIGASIALPAESVWAVRAAWNGRDAAVLRTSSQGLTSFVISSTGVTKAASVAVSANAQRDIAIAANGSNYLTVWTEKTGTYAARLSLDGVALDGRGNYLGPNTSKPSVAFDGQSYLVVLQAPFSGYLAENVLRIDPATGTVMSTASISGSNLRIASNGSERVAVWTDILGGVVTAFLTPSGALASIPVFLAVPPSGPPLTTLANLTLTWNGAIWLVTWEEQVHPLPLPQPPSMYPYVEIPPTIAIRGVRLSEALAPIDTQPITIASSPNGNIRSSRAASDSHDFLVAWTSDAIHVRRVLASGAIDANTSLFAGMVQDLVWDGTTYDLAFATGQQPFTPGDLLDARLTQSGQPQETLVISGTSDDDRSAAFVSLGNGRALSAYTRIAHEPLYAGVERAFAGMPHRVRGRTSRREN